MRAIITSGLYIFYLIFHCGFYCRSVYDADKVIIEKSRGEVSLMEHFCTKAAVYTAERFVLQETFLSLKIRGL